jgi:glycosyltransferase involved in cell wall biosynthesis
VSYFEDYPFASSPQAPKVVWQRSAYLLATKIICWSNLEKEYISRFLPVVRDKIAVIPLCQSIPEETHRPRSSPQGRTLKVLFAGRPLAKRKGFEHLASALRELVAKGHQVSLTVADAFTNSQNQARVRFSHLLSGIAVNWVRDLDREGMRTLYRSVHVVVVPSVYDSWCKVLTEAIAEGTPVIATDATGAAAFFSPDEVPRARAGDSKALVHAIESLVSDYPGRLAATQRARDRMKAGLTLEKHAARLRQLIGLD